MPKIGLNTGYIRGELARHMPKYFEDGGQLIKVTAGTRGATVTAGTAPTETSYPCTAWVSTYDEQEMRGTSIRQGDAKIGILGGTLPDGVVPSPNDKVIVKGVTYRLIGEPGSPGVKSDADGAKYTCHARA